MNTRLHITTPLPRRRFIQGLLAGAGALAAPGGLLPAAAVDVAGGPKPPYGGPNVIIVRFGGGARRRETIDPQYTYAPFLCREFARRGTLFPQMQIDSFTP